MLIIPEGTKEYFLEVQKTAHDMQLSEVFEQAMLGMHLYGCSWDDPERAKCELFKDFAPLSFGFVIDFRNKDGSYSRFVNGGLIYQGPNVPADGSFPSLTVSIGLDGKTGWFTHT